jgi:uncharacterized repeat protein (TIGR02543 family)
MPENDITLHAKWIKNYTISFDSNGGSSVDPLTQAFGSDVKAPSAPTKTGFTFADWYADSHLTKSYTFVTMPDSDITLFAKWILRTYKIAVDEGSNGTVSPGTAAVDYGSALTFHIKPKTGCHIVDVAVDGSSVGPESSYTFSDVKSDHTISATFARNARTGAGAVELGSAESTESAGQ